MPIPDHKITNSKSFLDVTTEPRQIAGLYFYQVLDCLFDLAHAVAMDFRKRPQIYRDLGQPSIATTLGSLNAQYGSEFNVLSEEQRLDTYLPVFGHWDSSMKHDGESYPRLQNEIIAAASAFAERAVDTGVAMLRERMRTTHRPFKDYLQGLHGESVRFSKEQSLDNLGERVSYPVLRSARIAAVFGVTKTVPSDDYPYTPDPVQDVLVEQISKQLMTGSNHAQLTRERIANLQRAALRGAEAIATAIDFDESAAQTDQDLDLLITKCYTWGAALRCVLDEHRCVDERPKAGAERQPASNLARVTSTVPGGYRG